MNLNEVLALYDREQRQEIEFPGMRKEVLPRVVRFVRPAPGMSFILYSALDETTADETIDEQIAYFREHALRFEWKTYAHDRPADLAKRLVAHGFEAEEEDAIMVLDLAATPPALLSAPPADVRRLIEPSRLGDVVGILESVWGGDFNWVYDRLGTHMGIPGYLSVYVVYVDGIAACAGWTYFSSEHFATLWGGSTLEAYRHRGLYTAVLAARVREAQARRLPYLTIDAGIMSRPIVERHGFELITRSISCEWKDGPTGV